MTFKEYNKFCKDTQILTDNVNRMMTSDNEEEVKHYFFCVMERLKTIMDNKLESLAELKAQYEV